MPLRRRVIARRRLGACILWEGVWSWMEQIRGRWEYSEEFELTELMCRLM